jgi:hypothetical protein
MTDFVTRLETELREAAVRRERFGVVGRAAIPRMRLALAELPSAAIATVLLGLALAGVAILLASSPERSAQGDFPAALRGTWQAGSTELRLYPAGSTRCANLGLGSSEPCYTIGSADTGVAREWGDLSVARDELTLRASRGGAPGTYRWLVDGQTLRLTKVSDPMTARAEVLASQPLLHARTHRPQPRLPIGWTARTFTSELYGYSIRYPGDWSARTARTPGKPDRLSPVSARSALPVVAVTAEDLPAGTSQGGWSAIVHSRPEAGGCAPAWYRRRSVDGEPAMVTRYLACNGADEQWASFAHNNRGYTAVWRGKVGRTKADGPRFDALLRSVVFSR